MGRVVVSELVTLDGTMEAPEEWSFPFQDAETGKFKHDELFASDALLLGETTYKIFAASWPSRTGDFADRMNAICKYVVSAGPDGLTWNNSQQIREGAIEEISKLRQQPGRDILVVGSGALVESLMQHDLVDEYRFMLHPIVLGHGKRLFEDGCYASLRMVQVQSFKTGMVLLRYQPQRSQQHTLRESSLG